MEGQQQQTCEMSTEQAFLPVIRGGMAGVADLSWISVLSRQASWRTNS